MVKIISACVAKAAAEWLCLFARPIEDNKGVAVFLQVCRHAAAHYAQTDETNFHLRLLSEFKSLVQQPFQSR
jgi:LPS sulfotransferase NodH